MNHPTLKHIHAKTNLFNTWKMDISKHKKNQLQIECKKWYSIFHKDMHNLDISSEIPNTR